LLAKLQARDDWDSQTAAAKAIGTTQPSLSRLLARHGLTLNDW
jgi:DNA-binding transcriptional LysR family regulator